MIRSTAWSSVHISMWCGKNQDLRFQTFSWQISTLLPSPSRCEIVLVTSRLTTNYVSVNDSCQPRVGQSTLAAKHLHLQPQDFQGTIFWISIKIFHERYEYPRLHLHLYPVEFSEIDCQNYFISRKILFCGLNKIFLLRKYKICQ